MNNTTLAAAYGELLETLAFQYRDVATTKQIKTEAEGTWDYQLPSFFIHFL